MRTRAEVGAFADPELQSLSTQDIADLARPSIVRTRRT